MESTPQSERLDCLPTSIILMTSLVADVNNRLAIMFTVVEDTNFFLFNVYSLQLYSIACNHRESDTESWRPICSATACFCKLGCMKFVSLFTLLVQCTVLLKPAIQSDFSGYLLQGGLIFEDRYDQFQNHCGVT